MFPYGDSQALAALAAKVPEAAPQQDVSTVGFHNFNLRIFNLRVSNPNKLIVDVFVDTMSDFNVPGSRPKKHDAISEIDRNDASYNDINAYAIIISVI